jgi:hypothetical protein
MTGIVGQGVAIGRGGGIGVGEAVAQGLEANEQASLSP